MRVLAERPAATETLEAPGHEIRAEVKLYDPVALWVLARVHSALAMDRHPPPASGFAAYALADVPNGKDAVVPEAPSEARAMAANFRERVTVAKRCNPASVGAQLTDELGLANSLADGVLRRTAARLLADGQCDVALGLLRETLDVQASDRVSYRNEPGFLVQVATAAVCSRRTSEAIGALRAVRREYPEAQGALTAVEQLAVSRLMGGVSGLQKRQ